MWLLLLFLPATLALPRLPQLGEHSTATSEGFQKAGEELLAAMNLSVDPCTDFYEFSCGNWVENHPIPADKVSVSTFMLLYYKVQKEMKDLYESSETSSSKAINQLRLYYRACVNEAEVTHNGPKFLLKEIEEMGYFPLIHGSQWDESRYDLTDLLISIENSRGTDLFLTFSADGDFKNGTLRRLRFDQAELALGKGTRSYYLDKKKFGKSMAAYHNLLIQRAIQLTKDAGFQVDEEKISKAVDEVVRFETNYAEIMVPEENKRNYSARYHLKRFDDLDKMVPVIDWNKYFAGIMPQKTKNYVKENPLITVTDPVFMQRLTNLLKSTDPEVITNYIMFRLMGDYGLELGGKYDDIYEEYAREMHGKNERSPRWEDCVSDAQTKLAYVSGAMYVRRHFEAKEFRRILKENGWMDEETGKLALEKLDFMQKLIAYPDFILSDAKLDEFYKDLDIKEDDSFHEMYKKVIHFKTKLDYGRMLEPYDRSEFKHSAATVNAFYSGLKNAIIFPAAILQYPVFSKQRPMAMNYGGIGAMIGHEITHGFDAQGRQFDKVGTVREWWDSSTTEKYKEKIRCMIEQYGNITIPGTGLAINGKLTLDENIADNGGVKQAFRAYKQYLARNGAEKRIPGLEQFDNEQMFFIGYGQVWCSRFTHEIKVRLLLTDPHPPEKQRVNVVLGNQPEFAAAFKCPPNSPMSPSKKCSVW